MCVCVYVCVFLHALAVPYAVTRTIVPFWSEVSGRKHKLLDLFSNISFQ